MSDGDNNRNNVESTISYEADTAASGSNMVIDSPFITNEKTIKSPVSGLRIIKKFDSDRAIELFAPPHPSDIEEMEDLVATVVKNRLTNSDTSKDLQESIELPSLPRKGSRTNLNVSSNKSFANKGTRQ